MEKARRYNKGKLRYDLLPSYALSKVVEVYTKGSEKYTILNEDGSIKESGDNNWRKGMSWNSTIGSVNRHIEAFKQGEDFDLELNTFHLANAAWGLLSLLEYYKIYPQGDDRSFGFASKPRIALDIDDVLASFSPEWAKLWSLPEATCWLFDRDMGEHFKQMEANNTLESFMLSLPQLIEPHELPFEPAAYITARCVDSSITEKWLDFKGFPQAPVISVGLGNSKVQAMIDNNIDIIVDDSYHNFIDINAAGKCCFLYDRPHNSRYNVGFKRIKDFSYFQ